MKKKKIQILGICAIIFSILFSFWFFYLRNQDGNKLIMKGNNIIATVEIYRKEHGRLPNSLRELGLPETEKGPIFYEKRGNTDYVVYFNFGFDEIKAYHSDTQKWEDSYF